MHPCMHFYHLSSTMFTFLRMSKPRSDLCRVLISGRIRHVTQGDVDQGQSTRYSIAITVHAYVMLFISFRAAHDVLYSDPNMHVGGPNARVEARRSQLPHGVVQGVRHIVWVQVLRCDVCLEQCRVYALGYDGSLPVSHGPVITTASTSDGHE
jgi:hypothetical protein